MDYEKKYKNALEWARLVMNGKTGFIRKEVEEVFPELKESEDEIIRKALISGIKQDMSSFQTIYGIDLKKVLAWLEKQKYTQRDVDDAYLKGITGTKNELEKQGKNNSQVTLPTFTFDDVLALQCCMETVKKVQKDEELYNQLQSLHSRLYDSYWLEKQGEEKPILDFKASNWYVSKVDGKIHDMTYNPTDKVKPKFKVGDWVVYDHRPYQVVELPKEGYINLGLRGRNGKIEWAPSPYCRHWTIEDAKEGDVLCYKDEVLLYKHDIKDWKETSFGGIVYYCCYDGKRFITDSFYSLTEQDKIDIHPATKEQRDLLFSKMKEAGYEWDESTKELKKINSYCQENCKGYQETGKCFFDGGCDAKHKVEQESVVWSKEDEDNLRYSEHHFKTFLTDTYYDTFCNWLKSLKVRLGGK